MRSRPSFRRSGVVGPGRGPHNVTLIYSQRGSTPVVRCLTLVTIALCLLTASGCFHAPPPPERTRRAADERLQKICQEDYHLNVVIKPLKNTVWVYLPLKEKFFDYKAMEQKDNKPPKANSSRVIKFLDGEWADKNFNFKFAVIDEVNYPLPDPGFSSYFPESFTNAQRNILTAIFRAYGDLEKVPGDIEFVNQARQLQHENLVKAYIKTDKAPDFFVMVITDITRGIESRVELYFPDLLRGSTDPSFTEEYQKRMISKELKGYVAAIDDTVGEYLHPTEISLPQFLTEQMQQRIRFKYQRSDFPPQDENVNEILKVIAATVSGYHFEDFNGVKLEDLVTGKNYDFRREQLGTFGE